MQKDELIKFAKDLKQSDKAKLLNILLEAVEKGENVEETLCKQLEFIRKWSLM